MSLNHFSFSGFAGLYVLNPKSVLNTKKLKSYRNPKPVPTAISFKEFTPLKTDFSFEILSKTFHILPASTKTALYKFPNTLNLNSLLSVSYILATIKSKILSLEPGPRL
jgi:hypothetical protein